MTTMHLTSIRQDLGHSLRMLLKRPGFTIIVALTLGFSIGANTTIFTWIKAVLLQPLPGIERPEDFEGRIRDFRVIDPDGNKLDFCTRLTS
jgi:putative ABC transport system permease protein